MSLPDALDWVVFSAAGPFLVALMFVTFVVTLALVIRKEWQRAGSMSEQRLMAVRAYTEPRLVVPEHWTIERTR